MSWNSDAVSADDIERLRRQRDDLAILVRKLVREVRKTTPDSGLSMRAMDYLRHGLEGSPLRQVGTDRAKGV